MATPVTMTDEEYYSTPTCQCFYQFDARDGLWHLIGAPARDCPVHQDGD